MYFRHTLLSSYCETKQTKNQSLLDTELVISIGTVAPSLWMGSEI